MATSDGALVVATWDGEITGAVPAGVDGVLLGVPAGADGVFFGAVPAGAEELPVGYGGTTGEVGALGEVGGNDGPEEEATCEGED